MIVSLVSQVCVEAYLTGQAKSAAAKTNADQDQDVETQASGVADAEEE